VIVGPNASGKSSILEGIQRISYLEDAVINFFGVKSRIASDNQVIEACSSLESRQEISKPISFLFNNSDGVKILISIKKSRLEYDVFTEDELYFGSRKLSELSFNLSHLLPSIFEENDKITLKPKFLCKLIRFSSSPSLKPSYSKLLKPILEQDGRGLATVFSNLQEEHSEKFDLIQSKMLSIIPNLTKIRIRRAEVPALNWFNITDEKNHLQEIARETTATGQELLFDFVNATGIPASRVSEGTLFALTVLVAVASSEGDTVVLIDDLERGLHPKAVRDLMKALRDIQAITPGLQIVATSHSPYVLHELEPKEVRVVTLDPELGTLIAPLEAYPNFDQWRNEMTPGEFWSFVGEDWVKDLFLSEKSRV
jgi:AAA15 family ATPase/GTPase